MRIWTRKSALIQPRTSLGKSEVRLDLGDARQEALGEGEGVQEHAAELPAAVGSPHDLCALDPARMPT